MNPYLPLPSFRRRDARAPAAGRDPARASSSGARRRASDAKDLLLRAARDPEPGRQPALPGRHHHRDVHLDDVRRAPHHVDDGLLDADRAAPPPRPAWSASSRELDELYADGREVSYQALREMPAARVRDQGDAAPAPAADHPDAQGAAGLPLQGLDGPRREARWRSRRRSRTACPSASRSRSASIPPATWPPREEDKQVFAWIPFGGGRHRCVGAAFAMMQLKAIFSVLLRRYEFEMAQPLRELPQRPLEDGRAARAALPGALPPARGRGRRAARRPRSEARGGAAPARAGCACASTATCVRATASAPARRPRSSASIRRRARWSLLRETAPAGAAGAAGSRGPPLPDPRALAPRGVRPQRSREETIHAWLPPRRARGDDAPLGRRQRPRRRDRRLGADGRLLRRGRDLQLEQRRRSTSSSRAAATRSAASCSAPRWPVSRSGPTPTCAS